MTAANSYIAIDVETTGLCAQAGTKFWKSPPFMWRRDRFRIGL